MPQRVFRKNPHVTEILQLLQRLNGPTQSALSPLLPDEIYFSVWKTLGPSIGKAFKVEQPPFSPLQSIHAS